MIIGDAHYQRMKRAYQPKLASFLAAKAAGGHLVTYGELAERFGGVARGYGDKLGGITIFCRDRGWPLLPVVVVNQRTQRPSEGAQLYFDFGLKSSDAIDAEQQRCFTFDWSQAAF